VQLAAYEIDRYEVTVSEYRNCVSEGRCTMPSADGTCNYTATGRDNHPINCVNWHQAKAYCEYSGGRLPTEAEWEYAARGNDVRIFPWGDSEINCSLVNYGDEDRTDGCGLDSTHPVCAHTGGNSPFGLCDMSGNVEEWCHDYFDSGYYAQMQGLNPSGPTGTERILRGGGWYDDDGKVTRVSFRYYKTPEETGHNIGFRCVYGGGFQTGMIQQQQQIPQLNNIPPIPVGDDMVVIPEGNFMMGCSVADSTCDEDEKPARSVHLGSYQLDRHEATVAEYRACMAAGSCSAPGTEGNCNFIQTGRDNHPVNCVSWDQAKSFCAWRSKRLPTEAEWEYAARGVDQRIYPWGNQGVSCDLAVWGDGDNTDGCGLDSTAPVCSKSAGFSAYGLCDMAGNVEEWCSDWYGDDYYGKQQNMNPGGPATGTEHILRGGGWYDDEPKVLRTSFRYMEPPSQQGQNIGFRCAK
jgi:formylglycine-generating enzyme